MTWKCPVQNFREIASELTEKSTKSMRSRLLCHKLDFTSEQLMPICFPRTIAALRFVILQHQLDYDGDDLSPMDNNNSLP